MKKSALSNLIKEQIKKTLFEEDYNFKVGEKIKIPKKLTHDPYNQKGKEGKIVYIDKPLETAVVKFKSKLGLYNLNALEPILDEISQQDVNNQKEYNNELKRTVDLTNQLENDDEINESLEDEDDDYYEDDDSGGFDDSDLTDDFTMGDDEEPTKKDLKQDDPLVLMAQELKNTKSEMKSLVKKWKEAEGDEKQDLLDQLKTLTKIKNELEAFLS